MANKPPLPKIRFTDIWATPIKDHFLWQNWTIGYHITMITTQPARLYLQQRKAGLTPKGRNYAWRVARTATGTRTSQSFDLYIKRLVKKADQLAHAYSGILALRGQAYTTKATPTYSYSDIITLDFGNT